MTDDDNKILEVRVQIHGDLWKRLKVEAIVSNTPVKRLIELALIKYLAKGK